MSGAVPPAIAAALAARFELLGELGRGGMGVVLHARDRTTGQPVALKLLLEVGPSSPVRRERLRREAELAARLDHPGVVRTLAHGEEQGVPWVALELIEEARTLAQVLPGLGLRERVGLIRDVARALGHAHARGVVHRDVKPENVLIDARGQARVTDFGLAWAGDLAPLTRTGTQLGTPQYMPPEQVAGDREAQGPASDVWGLGVLLYLALADRHPFAAEDWLALVHQICAAPAPPLPDGTPPALVGACLAALQKEPGRRPPDGAALAALLERWLAMEARGPAARARGSRAPLGVLGLAGVGLLVSVLSQLAPSGAPPVAPPGSGASPPPPPPPAAPSGPLPEGCQPGSAPGRALRPLPDGSLLELAWVPWPGEGGFWLGVEEVPRGPLRRWRAARAGQPAPAPAEDDALPATELPWEEAEAFCAWAGLRLPTAGEWRRAAELDGAPGSPGCRQLRDEVGEWLQDSLALHAAEPLRRAPGAPGRSPLQALGERLIGGVPPARAELEAARSRELGFRVAGPAWDVPWRVQAVGFEHLPDRAKGPWRSFQELLAQGGPTAELVLPRLDLRLPNHHALGERPEARGVPGAVLIPQDFFALRAEAEPELEPGRWRLLAQADDGLRVWVDGVQRYDRWSASPSAMEHRFELAARRRVALRVEMVEFYVDARLEVWLERLP